MAIFLHFITLRKIIKMEFIFEGIQTDSIYFKTESFRCMIDNCSSDIFQYENGVPQGAALSGTLFIINILLYKGTKVSKAELFSNHSFKEVNKNTLKKEQLTA